MTERVFSAALGCWGRRDEQQTVFSRRGMTWTQEGEGDIAVRGRTSGLHSLLTIRCIHGGEAVLRYPTIDQTDADARRQAELLYASYAEQWLRREAEAIRLEFGCRCGLPEDTANATQ